MADVVDFLDRWDRRLPFEARTSPVQSRWGNLNAEGGTHLSRALALTPVDQGWRQALEPGVADLVEFFALERSLVTYDSCEGHAYPNAAISPGLRRVGLFPRTEADWSLIASLASHVSTLSTSQLAGSPVEPSLVRTHLFSEAQPNQSWEVVDLGLAPRREVSWEDYFSYLNAATEILIRGIRSIPFPK